MDCSEADEDSGDEDGSCDDSDSGGEGEEGVKKAAAAMAVGIGNLSDPENCQVSIEIGGCIPYTSYLLERSGGLHVCTIGAILVLSRSRVPPSAFRRGHQERERLTRLPV